MEENIINYLNTAQEDLEYEKLIFIKYVDKNKNVLDIGACMGVMSMILSQLTTKKVYVYEPNPISFNLLTQNIKNNNIKNVIAHNYGIGNKFSETKIIYSHPENIGQTMLGVNKEQIKKSNGVKVDLFKLDDISVKNIGFIKIDVEGYELEVLRSGKNLLTNNEIVVAVEYHGFNINGKWKTTKSKVLNIMKKYKYNLIEEIGNNKLIFKNYE